MKKLALTFAISGAAVFCLPAGALAEGDAGTITKEKLENSFPKKRPYSPYADRNFPIRPLFGDTHLHTAVSFDAGIFGARLSPRDAYRFAKGQQVTTNTGQQAKLSRPLDFLVSRTIPTTWGCSRTLRRASPTSLPIRRAASGTR
jgi:hypothetical protein